MGPPANRPHPARRQAAMLAACQALNTIPSILDDMYGSLDYHQETALPYVTLGS